MNYFTEKGHAKYYLQSTLPRTIFISSTKLNNYYTIIQALNIHNTHVYMYNSHVMSHNRFNKISPVSNAVCETKTDRRQ